MNKQYCVMYGNHYLTHIYETDINKAFGTTIKTNFNVRVYCNMSDALVESNKWAGSRVELY